MRAMLRVSKMVLLSLLPASAATAGDGFTTYGDVARYALPASAAILALTHDDSAGLNQLLVSGAVTIGAT